MLCITHTIHKKTTYVCTHQGWIQVELIQFVRITHTIPTTTTKREGTKQTVSEREEYIKEPGGIM